MDSTFHAAPTEDIVRRWVEMTPTAFRFTCKLPRQITHIRRLHDCAVELKSFLRAIESLRPKLQVILIQLPPSLTPKDDKPALRKFLPQLPRDFRFAIEFRHAGWHRPQFIRLLEKYRICWVWADSTPLNERNLAPFEFLPRTTDFLYLRLLGDYKQNTTLTVATSIVIKNCCGNVKPPWKAGLSRSSGILPKCGMSGHLPATSSRDSHLKPANVSPSVWASHYRFLPKQHRRFHPTEGRSLIFSYNGSCVRLCFSKTHTC